tara:strand:- start:222 stop:668 length:447 start_codon:yes stop_codon:yes gene_type:complete
MFHKHKKNSRQRSGIYNVMDDDKESIGTGYVDIGWGTNTGYQNLGYHETSAMKYDRRGFQSGGGMKYDRRGFQVNGYDVRGSRMNRALDLPKLAFHHMAEERSLPEIVIDPLNIRGMIRPAGHMCMSAGHRCMNMMGNARERIMDMMK